MGCAASSQSPALARKLSEANLQAFSRQQGMIGTTPTATSPPFSGNLPTSPSSPLNGALRARRRARDSAESFMSAVSGISQLSGVSGKSFLFKDTWDAGGDGSGSGKWSRHRPDKHFFSDMTKRFRRREEVAAKKQLEKAFDTVIAGRHERERLELEQTLVATRKRTWVV